MLALAIIATVLVCTQPVPGKRIRSGFETFWVLTNIVVTITTIWVLYARIA